MHHSLCRRATPTCLGNKKTTVGPRSGLFVRAESCSLTTYIKLAIFQHALSIPKYAFLSSVNMGTILDRLVSQCGLINVITPAVY
ncbi:hypothetical protein A0H81_00055 [Grifola frondosa]|uniref:Uncharacterized protein n=1 Tax=Grifola frondosa TaxID=5627 RepID=A0A1C7MRQ1_GRIFR|nr:hypothetical protein A0H81_00055 [Grifola frondosa]